MSHNKTTTRRRLIAFIVAIAASALSIVGLTLPDASAAEPIGLTVIDGTGATRWVTAYNANGHILMSVDDLGVLTRSEVSSNGAAIHTLAHAHGLVSVTVNTDTNSVTTNNSTKSATLTTAVVNGTAYVEAYPLIAYFGADWAVDTDRALVAIVMPQVTFWESLYFFSQHGQDLATYAAQGPNVPWIDEPAMAVLNHAVLLSVGKGVSAQDVVYQAAQLDPAAFGGVQDQRNSYFKGLSDALTGFSTTLGISSTMTTTAAFVDASSVYMPLIRQAVHAKSAGDIGTWLDLFDQAGQTYANYKNATEQIGSTTGKILTGVDTFVTAMQRAQIGQGVRDAFIDTFDPSTTVLANHDDLSTRYLIAARVVTAELSSQVATATGVVLDEAVKVVGDKLIDKAEEALFGLPLSISVDVAQAIATSIDASAIGKYTPFGEITKAEQALVATYSAGYYQQAKAVYYGVGAKLAGSDYSDAMVLSQLRDTYIVMLRFALLNNQANIAYAEQSNYFSKYDKQISQLQNSANELAKALDQVEASIAAPLPSLTELSKDDSNFSTQIMRVSTTGPTAACLAAANLPSGIDPRVCGPLPAQTTKLPPDEYGDIGFDLPSRNIGCQLYSYGGSSGAGCWIGDYTWKPAPEPPRPAGMEYGGWMGSNFGITDGKSYLGQWIVDGSPEPTNILPYGQAVTAGTVACVSQAIGLSCWDTATGHGFWVSSTDKRFW